MRCFEHSGEHPLLGIVLIDDGAGHSFHDFRKWFFLLKFHTFSTFSCKLSCQHGICLTDDYHFQGNLKAAITADVIQGITMIIISFGVIAQGIYESGGVKKAYVINKEHGT